MIRVAALTSSNAGSSDSLHLRIVSIQPLLEKSGIHVELVRLEKDPRHARPVLESLKNYDIAWLHRRIFWPSEMRILSARVPKIVLDLDDPICYSSSRPFNFHFARCIRFRATAKRCAAIFAASPGLANLAKPFCNNVHLIRLGADAHKHRMQAKPRQSGETLKLLWLGGASTFKYLEGARAHLEAVGLACPGVELKVVGHQTLVLKNLPVENARWSPESERKVFEECHVGLAPMAPDRWTQAKAALKPLQYLANGLPYIGHRVGVNEFFAEDGQNALLADTPAEWVEAVRKLANDESRRFAMGVHGVDYIRRHHTPEVLADLVARAFRQIMAGPLRASA